jgi:lipid II:glycine glycyltransferase (peptidoglycan interpeptide bridge formation enzyme)
LKIVINGDVEKYKSYLVSHPRCNFAQSPEWAGVKSDWKNEIITVEDDCGVIKGAMSVLIRKVPFLGSALMYSSRGPVCDLHDADTLKALLEGAQQVAKKYRGYLLKLDTDVEIDDIEYIQIMKKLGFKIQEASRNFEGIQPRFVFRLDIAGKTEDEVMQTFHQKWRYNIRLAARKGVTVKIGEKKDIRRVHGIMLETGIRDNFVVRRPEYFEKMFDCMAPEHMRLYLAYYQVKS